MDQQELRRRYTLLKITSKGQLTIPQQLRERLGFLPGTEVEVVAEGQTLRIVKRERPSGRGQRLVARLRGKATVEMTTDEIMALTRSEDQ